MTDKEKARAYDEALEKARKRVLTEPQDHTDKILKDIFPQLRESEDERIRKEIVGVIQKHYPNTPESYRWISWLEKQKEQKPNNNFLSIEQQMEAAMIAIRGGMSSKSQEWSEEDEAAYNAFICEVVNEKMNPTIEQVKWLRGIRDRFKSLHPNKQEWSEEDEEIRNAILGFLNPNKGGTKYSSNAELVEWSNWLKSLRPSKDCSDCAKHLEGYISGRCDAENKLLEQFSALITPEDELHIKPRWKPSEEQMNGLAHAINLDVYDAKRYGLESLYNDLKKLM